RPLTPVSADNSEQIISPASFTTPYSRIRLPNFDLKSDDPNDPTYFPRQTTATDLSELWKKMNTNLSRFWLIWRRAYLTELRERENRQHRSQQLNVDRRPRIDEVVIIEDIDKPRHDWTTGRIIEIIDSNDGQCRSARIKTTKGTIINRSVKHLYPLEIDHAGREASHCSNRSETTITKTTDGTPKSDTDEINDPREQQAASDV
uniref:DUF5641 domain-containing protein n=1 Tax=Panagrellus redivivus TaxID=6233 RepID=A0A7E4VY60_PANRE